MGLVIGTSPAWMAKAASTRIASSNDAFNGRDAETFTARGSLNVEFHRNLLGVGVARGYKPIRACATHKVQQRNHTIGWYGRKWQSNVSRKRGAKAVQGGMRVKPASVETGSDRVADSIPIHPFTNTRPR